MEVSVNRSTNLPTAANVQTQTSSNSSDDMPKPFDPALLKEEKAAHSAARELAQATSPAQSHELTSTRSTQRETPRDLHQGAAEWSRQDAAPNWSSYSAASKGYTFTERAINLYRHIGALA